MPRDDDPADLGDLFEAVTGDTTVVEHQRQQAVSRVLDRTETDHATDRDPYDGLEDAIEAPEDS